VYPDAREPSFQKEALAELGGSLENALFQGLIEPMTWLSRLDRPLLYIGQRRKPLDFETFRSPPIGYFLESGWPTFDDAEKRTHKTPILLGQPKLNNVKTKHPILISHFEQAQRSDFWSAGVRKMGVEVFASSMKAVKASKRDYRAVAN
jgi:hypothetical protein